MKHLLITVVGLIIFSSCNPEIFFDGPNQLMEDFEEVDSLSDLIGDNGNWTFLQTTGNGNIATIDTTNVHSGLQSMRFVGVRSESITSKSDLANNGLAFHKGKVVRASVWYFIEGEQNLDYLFLFDIEESVAIGLGPGVRIAIAGEEGHLVVERNKFGQRTIRQEQGQEISFPRNEWVKLGLEMKLEQKKTGYIKVWQNDTLVIDANNEQTLPRDNQFFRQGTKGIYNSIQVGITASSTENDAVLYVDDISVEEL